MKPNPNAPRPGIKLTHLRAMTDDVGLVQHAVYSTPRRQEGYATDDNARALVVAVRRHRQSPSPFAQQLAQVYLAFLSHGMEARDRFPTFMGYDRRWIDTPLSDDTHGRCLWAVAEAASSNLPDPMRRLSGELFERGICAFEEIDAPRGQALTIIAIDAMAHVDRRRDYLDKAALMADRLVAQCEAVRDDHWVWFEDEMTYSNARLPHALLCAYRLFGHERTLRTAEDTLRFLDRMTTRDGLFVPIGTEGWADRHGTRALYDQQPVEAGTMVEAATLAHTLTGHDDYRRMARRAFDWFTGRNTLGKPLADFADGSCCDGLHTDRVNMNRGGESTVSLLLAAQCMDDMDDGRRTTDDGRRTMDDGR